MKKATIILSLMLISFIAIRHQQTKELTTTQETASRSIASTEELEPASVKVSKVSETYLETSELFSAIENGNWKLLEKYLLSGGDPNFRDPQGRAFLHWAALQGRGDMIQLLLRSGADIDAQDQEGVTALMLATGQSQMESLEQLLAAGADLFKENEIGQTALLLAVEASSSEGFDKLIDAGADLHDRFGEAELDAYHLASSNRDTKMMDRLIQADPNFVHSQDVEGRTVSHHACAEGAIDVVATAIRHGGDLRRQNRMGQSALSYAEGKGNDSCIAFVEEAGLRDVL